MLESYYWNGIIIFGFALTFVGYFVTGFFYQSFTWYAASHIINFNVLFTPSMMNELIFFLVFQGLHVC